MPTNSPTPEPPERDDANSPQEPLIELDLFSPPEASTAYPPPAAVPLGGDEAGGVEYAKDPSVAAGDGALAFGVDDNLAIRLQRGFWADCAASFGYPFLHLGNAATFLVVAVIAMLELVLPAGNMIQRTTVLLIAVRIIVWGWLFSQYFCVIQTTAIGSRNLPGLTPEQGLIDGAFRPAIQFVGAVAVVLLPATFLAIALFLGLLPAAASVLVPFLLVAGLFFAPMSLLLASFDAQIAIFRLDLVGRTIAGTIGHYLVVWLIILIPVGLHLTSFSSGLLSSFGLGSFIPSLAGLGDGGGMVLIVLRVYLTIVVMRILGLYYMHNRSRFAFVME